MPMNVERINGTIERMRVSDFRERKAAAYAAGTMKANPKVEFVYKFEQEMYQKGVDDDTRLHKEIIDGMR